MRHLFTTLLLAAGLGVAAFGLYYTWHSKADAEPMAGEVDWLREEFNLDPDQFARVRKIHDDYSPICQTLCDRVIEAKRDLEHALVHSSGYTDEVEEQLARFSRVKEDCHRSMLQHVYEVAAVMNPEERRRYLALAKSQVTREAHIDP